ncbi:hypothetical protein [Campylobacter canadensis]|uniref:Lipoprotein n=1 Tax=Campylobacter canadensis TaxID=449520 RepID=A0ABS7WT33_9BACT|nr:hypothetical protein [Campylobacter canadensis]MBZ7987917.1 hypothetical protein [Campylobacter canadensis]MBZ7995393.1 hypothetical protein [Campylobacter canadensis]MBZ7997062.1 hypothetical protein [Campylobacter canadensis]MBZ7998890.1 hypothetical protein [Campylobacter canadensis]MBZ8000569.1 hypothetical protein [Campylobacter canadensis]
MKKIVLLLITCIYLFSYSCNSPEAFEQFKQDSIKVLSYSLNSLDLEIYTRIFKPNIPILIEEDATKSICYIGYKYVMLSKEEALAYSIIGKNQDYYFKNYIQDYLRSDSKIEETHTLFKELAKIIPNSIYIASSNSQKIDFLGLAEFAKLLFEDNKYF